MGTAQHNRLGWGRWALWQNEVAEGMRRCTAHENPSILGRYHALNVQVEQENGGNNGLHESTGQQQAWEGVS
eukprot:956370-Pelagomonas_calceolata.AAC.5